MLLDLPHSSLLANPPARLYWTSCSSFYTVSGYQVWARDWLLPYQLSPRLTRSGSSWTKASTSLAWRMRLSAEMCEELVAAWKSVLGAWG